MLIKAWQSGLTAAALFMLAVTVVALVAFAVAPVVREGWRKWRKRASAGVAVAASAFAIIYGGSKGVNAGADEGIALVGVTVAYDATNDVTSVAVAWTNGTVTTATPVSVRNAESEQWRELVKIGAAIETGATNVLSFTVAGDESAHGFWWVGFDTPAVIVETAGITITNFVATSKSVSIAWTCDATNQQYFTVQRKHPADAEWQVAGDVWTNTTFALSGFTVGETWMWRIIGERLPTARDYVQDGLVALWDGIERGTNALVWTDHSGNGYDATQRVANAGWRWDADAYVGTSQNGHGFRTPIAIASAIKSNIYGHTIEIVFKPDNNERQTLFGQFKDPVAVSGTGLNLEYSPHLAGHFRVYYSGNPDANTAAWKNTERVRMTCAVVSEGAHILLYENGVQKARNARPSSYTTVGNSRQMIIGGENERSNMSIVGELCAVRVYTNALTAAKIAHNAETDRKRFRLP